MSWKDPQKWEAMKSGVDCSFCVSGHVEVNQFSYLVAELKQSYFRLPRNQFWRGYAILAFKRHATEIYELTQTELSEFWQDVALVAKAMNVIFAPVKINYAVYGNWCPHIHCHIFPQQFENDPDLPVTVKVVDEVLLSDEEYQKIIWQYKKVLTEMNTDFL